MNQDTRMRQGGMAMLPPSGHIGPSGSKEGIPSLEQVGGGSGRTWKWEWGLGLHREYQTPKQNVRSRTSWVKWPGMASTL